MTMVTRWLAHPFAVWTAILLCVAIRALACVVMPAAVESDSLAYFTMAQTFSNGEVMRDHFGQVAFYSPGYPLFLGSIFLITGASATLALIINLGLAALSCWLVSRIANRLGGPVAAGLAALAFAVWLPSILGATFIHKENLTTPLLLGLVLTLVTLRDARDPAGRAVLAGLLYGVGLLAGASSLLLIVVALWAVFTLASKERQALLAFGGGVLICLVPWLAHTNATFGKPVLTTNSGFNMYLGNNPAATGHFVSITDTPAGPGWHDLLKEKGEAGAADTLGQEAREWIIANPATAAGLAVKKLGLFWAPNLPDAQELSADKVTAIARIIDVVQHLLIIGLGLWGLWQLRARHDVRLIGLAIGGFWVVHALTYIIVRYRDPIMPLLIALAAVVIAQWMTGRKAIS
jgi:hypothetical protein